MVVMNVVLLTEFELDNITIKELELLICRTELIKCIAFFLVTFHHVNLSERATN